MTTSVDLEVLGDWNNLKGSRYHLVFGIWLILRNHAQDVRFFEGNDFLVNPATPPIVADNAPTPLVPIAATLPAEDVWVQLKCTRAGWTPTELLAENLLFNFICNSFVSERRGRPYRVRLVTEGENRREQVVEFVGNPPAKPVLHARLEEIVTQVNAALVGWGADAPSQDAIREHALAILRLLADTEPIMLDTLKAEVELELALACADRQQTKRLGSLLVGTMLEDAAGGPARARPYDAAWVNEVTGLAIRSDRPFDVDVIRACDLVAREVASQRHSPPFDPNRFVPRAGLVRALEQFAAAPETVFVLTGVNGTGKSWALADCATGRLAGRVRMLVRGPDLNPGTTLERLSADAFARYSDRTWRDEQVLARLVSVSREPRKGPLVVLLDLLGGGRLAVGLGAVVLAGLAAGLLGLGGGLALGERGSLALAGAGRRVELAAQALVLGLQVAEASLKGLAAGTQDGLHTCIIGVSLALPSDLQREANGTDQWPVLY